MQMILKKFRGDTAAILVLFLVTLLSMFQTWMYVLRTPAGFVYPLVHNYEQDFYWYLSMMHQGLEGSLLLTTHYTPENFAPQFVNTFFPAAGFLAGILGLSLPVVYTLLRLAGGTFLLYMGFRYTAELGMSRKMRITALLLIIAGAPLWYIQGGNIVQAGEFWTGLDPILRIAWLPHHTFANGLVILYLILIGRVVGSGSKPLGRQYLYYIYAALTGAVAVWLNPATLAILAPAVVLGIFYGIFHRNLRQITGMTVPVAGIIVPAAYLFSLQSSSFPWTAFRDWEKFVQYPLNFPGYLGVIGPVGILAILGIIFFFRKRKYPEMMTVLWFLIPFAGLFLLSGLLHMSNGRFLQTAGYIPAALLATAAVEGFSGLFGNYKIKVFNGLVILLILINIPAFVASYNRQMMYVGQNLTNPLVMIAADKYSAIRFLAPKKSGIIIAPSDVSTIIPAFTSYKTLVGHPTFTYNSPVKYQDLDRFYWSDNPEVMRGVMDKYGISTVWVPDWMIGQTNLETLGLRRIYANQSVSIYEK